MGIDFPLFSAVSCIDHESLVKSFRQKLSIKFFMPEIIRQILLRGLRAATQRTNQENLLVYLAYISNIQRQFADSLN